MLQPLPDGFPSEPLRIIVAGDPDESGRGVRPGPAARRHRSSPGQRGAGATPAALISYQQAKLWSKHPEEFGHGSLSGIIANEAAQNASNSGELIPTLALGIPGSSSMLLLLSALQIHGFIPGPFLIRDAPEMFYATIAGLLGGTVILLIVGMRMAGLMLRVVRIDRSVVLMTGLALVMLGV